MELAEYSKVRISLDLAIENRFLATSLEDSTTMKYSCDNSMGRRILAYAEHGEGFEQCDRGCLYMRSELEALGEHLQRTVASQVELIFNRLDDLEKVDVFAKELVDLIEERVAHFTKWEVQQHKDLKGQVTKLQEELAACKKELTRATRDWCIAMQPRRKKMPEHRSYAGAREAKQVYNFFWHLERYFKALDIDDEEKKVHMAVMYLTDIAASWWRHRYTDGCDVKTWEKFKRELQRQFYLDSVNDIPLTAEAEGSIREYVNEYSTLMLKIPEMSERQRLCLFIDRLQYWVATELRQREPHDLAFAMMIVERIGDFKQCERPRYPRHELPKMGETATDDEWNGDEGRCRLHKGEKKHEGSRKQGDSRDYKAYGGLEEDASTVQVRIAGGKEGRPEWMIPLVSKDGANARKGITVLQLDEGLTLCYVEWQMGPRTYAVSLSFPPLFPSSSSPNPPKSAGVGGCYTGSRASQVALSEQQRARRKNFQRSPYVKVRVTVFSGKRPQVLVALHRQWSQKGCTERSGNEQGIRTRRQDQGFFHQCNLAGSTACVTATNTCGLFPENTVTRTSTYGDLGSDVVSIQSTNRKTPDELFSNVTFFFLLVCTSPFLLEGLANGIQGMAGLGRSRISLPSQFSASFIFPRKFAVCLTSESNASGAVFFGDGPYALLPGVDESSLLTYTPLFINPEIGGVASSDYNTHGYVGTKISTVNPYTVLENEAFINKLKIVPHL
ncbi:hypothetical protein RJ639_022152 [Escallonia herrerae]|uniref:Retrotransposon gag domain-containing protein n=1 Tax=Escallonia herrerae TaxID=1293975 RepID=A0AA88V6D4_9ASTE|nr:hypothetical protein RJ639_022152 [Escallonia herrerae]